MNKCLAVILFSWLCLLPAGFAAYHTNSITTPGGSFAFSVDGSPATNPVIKLVAGVTNILNIQTASFHPVVITTASATSPQSANASPQNVFNQLIFVRTTTNSFPATLYYVCGLHGFFGQIQLALPPGPPVPNTILEIRVGTNIVMRSTGTNAFVPEFSSNLVSGAWSSVPNFTNTVVNGTNVTSFNRLDPICGQNVFLRLRQ